VTAQAILVWQQADGFWRWRYRDDEGVDLLSNDSHLTREEAITSASEAYPSVRLVEQDSEYVGLGLARSARRAAVGTAAVAGAAVVTIPVAVALGWRRLRRRLGLRRPS